MDGPLGVCRIGHKAAGQVAWRYAFTAGAPVLPGFARAPAFEF
jgi:protein-L-isoaspartate(D-aspartate) O-methyltransferase